MRKQDTLLAVFGRKDFDIFNILVLFLDVVHCFRFDIGFTGTKMALFFFVTSLMYAKHGMIFKNQYNILKYE